MSSRLGVLVDPVRKSWQTVHVAYWQTNKNNRKYQFLRWQSSDSFHWTVTTWAGVTRWMTEHEADTFTLWGQPPSAQRRGPGAWRTAPHHTGTVSNSNSPPEGARLFPGDRAADVTSRSGLLLTRKVQQIQVSVHLLNWNVSSCRPNPLQSKKQAKLSGYLAGGRQQKGIMVSSTKMSDCPFKLYMKRDRETLCSRLHT